MGIISRLEERGVKKAAEARAMKRDFSAAAISRLTANWTTAIKTGDSELRQGLRVIRARSRELSMNNDYARKYLKMCVTNVPGPNGIGFQNKAKNDNGELDVPANSRIEEGFAEWGKKGTPSVCGRYSWVNLQRILIETAARDGEVFIKLNRGYAGNRFQFAVQLIEADHVDEDYNLALDNGGQIRMGIEFDKWGRPAAYHFLTRHPGDYTYTGYTGQRYERVPAKDVLHVCIFERPTQSRGVPWMHSAMTRLNMLGGYEEAELVGSRVSAAKMGFFTTQEGAQGNPSTTEENGEMLMEAEPGTFEQLPPGLDFKSWDPSHPAGNFPFFLKAMLRGAASGLNVSYNSLASDLEGVNYSSIRSGTIEERDNWRILQAWMIEAFCQPVFEAWLDMALMTQAVALPPRKFVKLNAPKWGVRGWQWVDPLKDVKANIDAIGAGLKTRQMVLSEQGLDVEEIFEQLAEEKKLAESHGLSFGQDEKKEMTEDETDEDKDDKDGDVV